MDNRERNAKATEKQQHAKEVQEKVANVALNAVNAPIETQMAALTKRNSEYVFRLRKALTDGDMSEAEQVALLQKLLPEVIVAQHKGQPANQLYGPPIAKANEILHAPKPVKPISMWLKAVDSMMIFAVFMFALAALTVFTTKAKDVSQMKSFGVLSMLLLVIVAGGGLAIVQDKISQPKEKRMAIWKMVLLFAGIMIAMFLLVSVTVFIPSVINPVLPGAADVAVAVVIFGLRYLLRRRYGIKGNLFAPQQRANQSNNNAK